MKCVEVLVDFNTLHNVRDQGLVENIAVEELITTLLLPVAAVGFFTDQVGGFKVEVVMCFSAVFDESLWEVVVVAVGEAGGHAAESVEDLLHTGGLAVAAGGIFTIAGGMFEQAGGSGVGVGVLNSRFHRTLDSSPFDVGFAVAQIEGGGPFIEV